MREEFCWLQLRQKSAFSVHRHCGSILGSSHAAFQVYCPCSQIPERGNWWPPWHAPFLLGDQAGSRADLEFRYRNAKEPLLFLSEGACILLLCLDVPNFWINELSLSTIMRSVRIAEMESLFIIFTMQGPTRNIVVNSYLRHTPHNVSNLQTQVFHALWSVVLHLCTSVNLLASASNSDILILSLRSSNAAFLLEQLPYEIHHDYFQVSTAKAFIPTTLPAFVSTPTA